MKTNFNLELNQRLRHKINEHHNFAYEKQGAFLFPAKGRKKVDANAYNCICACLDRIDDLVNHCNSIKINNIFGLCDILNYGQTLIDCITMLAGIYQVRYQSDGDSTSFNQLGSDGTGNDEKYFKYLRSLCSVHPVETSRYKMYQGEEPEWCAYMHTKDSIMRYYSFNVNVDEELKHADFAAVVYRNDMVFNKLVPINVCEIVNYLEKRYNFIEQIINEVENYNRNLICQMQKERIPLPNEFNSYKDYLFSLKSAISERCGENKSYIVREWIAFLESKFENEKMQALLDKYQIAFKEGIARIHDGLQEMSIDHYFEVEPVECDTAFIPKEYSYSREKLQYLYPGHLIENEEVSPEEILIKSKNCDGKRIDEMLSVIEKAQVDNLDSYEMYEVANNIDRCYHVTNSEWARIQLKILEPYLSDSVKIDYHLNDWYVYLQKQIIFWETSRKRS